MVYHFYGLSTSMGTDPIGTRGRGASQVRSDHSLNVSLLVGVSDSSFIGKALAFILSVFVLWC